MSGPWVLALVAAVAGALVAWRGSRIAGGALVVGALVLVLGMAEVSLPSREDRASPSAGSGDGPWVLLVTLDKSAPAGLPQRLADWWVDVPDVGSVRPDAQGRIIVRGEPRSGYVRMNAVKLALRDLPHVASVERIR